jgi:hypothetical protein
VGAGFGVPAKMLDFQCRLKKTLRPMLNFPNQSRVFDYTRRAVRFWRSRQRDGWSFFVIEDALKQLQPSVEPNEESVLLAFDTHRAAIQSAAMRAYERKRRGSYELAIADF